MSVAVELRELKKSQPKIDDKVRLFFDGTIKIYSITESGQLGWKVMASKITGIGGSFSRYFEQQSEDGRFLKVEDLREAIDLWGKMRDQIAESRVRRQYENDIGMRSRAL